MVVGQPSKKPAAKTSKETPAQTPYHPTTNTHALLVVLTPKQRPTAPLSGSSETIQWKTLRLASNVVRSYCLRRRICCPPPMPRSCLSAPFGKT